jgi:hypothetical protein
MQAITEHQHLNATFSRKCYAKPGETQDKAIKRLMASIKRAARVNTQRFPQWTPKMTTRAYVHSFHAMNSLINAGHSDACPDTVPTLFDGPEVEAAPLEFAANDAGFACVALAA